MSRLTTRQMNTLSQTLPPETLVREPEGLSNRTQRIASIDLLRGLVMVIMALDHVRDYFHYGSMFTSPTDLEYTTPQLFLTRWVTHFCAPTFMFLTGTSAFLVGLRKPKKDLSIFLLTRGLWLILLEFTLINLGWSFNPEFPGFGLITIWALGFTMVVLSGLIFLPLWAILILGLAIVFGHNLLDPVHVEGKGVDAFLWSVVHEPNFFLFGGKGFFTGYPVLAWVGVGALGYCFGEVYKPAFGAVRRQRILLWMGLGSIALFLVVRALNIYGDPEPWTVQKNGVYTVMSFFNVTKYPPSLLYCLITLGPSILFLAFAERPLSWLAKKIVTIGRVPFFYYILHIYLIHALAMLAAEFYPGHDWSDMIVRRGWINLPGFGFSLETVYLIWIGLVVALYPFCLWYDRYKTRHKEQWWLSYL